MRDVFSRDVRRHDASSSWLGVQASAGGVRTRRDRSHTRPPTQVGSAHSPRHGRCMRSQAGQLTLDGGRRGTIIDGATRDCHKDEWSGCPYWKLSCPRGTGRRPRDQQCMRALVIVDRPRATVSSLLQGKALQVSAAFPDHLGCCSSPPSRSTRGRFESALGQPSNPDRLLPASRPCAGRQE